MAMSDCIVVLTAITEASERTKSGRTVKKINHRVTIPLDNPIYEPLIKTLMFRPYTLMNPAPDVFVNIYNDVLQQVTHEGKKEGPVGVVEDEALALEETPPTTL